MTDSGLAAHWFWSDEVRARSTELLTTQGGGVARLRVGWAPGAVARDVPREERPLPGPPGPLRLPSL